MGNVPQPAPKLLENKLELPFQPAHLNVSSVIRTASTKNSTPPSTMLEDVIVNPTDTPM